MRVDLAFAFMGLGIALSPAYTWLRARRVRQPWNRADLQALLPAGVLLGMAWWWSDIGPLWSPLALLLDGAGIFTLAAVAVALVVELARLRRGRGHPA